MVPPPPVGQEDGERPQAGCMPADRSAFLPPTPPRAPPSQVDFYDPFLLKDGGSSIAQHCSLTSFLLPISGIASSRLGHLPFHFSYSLEPAL